MSREETIIWTAWLWIASIGTTGWVVLSIQEPIQWVMPGVLFGIMFGVAMIAWLFRITYLAGVSRR